MGLRYLLPSGATVALEGFAAGISAAVWDEVARDRFYATWTAMQARTHGSAMYWRAFPCAHEVYDEDEAGRTCMTCRRPLPQEQR